MIANSFTVFPSIDLLSGSVVRLKQGAFDAVTSYEINPVDYAGTCVEAGATWLHVVDLDAARTGSSENRAIIAKVIAAQPSLAIQVGGGVRSADQARALFEVGARRVVLGTLVVSDPKHATQIVEEWPNQVVAMLDHKAGDVRVEGWEQRTGASLDQALARLSELGPLAAVAVTNTEVDGMLVGPDLEGLERTLTRTTLPVVASGGVRDLDDVVACGSLRVNERGLAGLIIGRALHEGHLDLAEAVRRCEQFA